MSFLLRTHYRLAYDSISRNRTRSFLTCLGIGIGVAAIILILSLMGSIKNLVSRQVSSAGSDLIVVRPSSEKTTLSNVIDQLTSSNQYLFLHSYNIAHINLSVNINIVSAICRTI